ncbi:sigma-54-dependent transcriptional regulator [Desulfolutivibrio sulfoxidireducens]|uniref:sigma-54-dependent transcriptional regulator n=1 Tax=Desulfolutivibrio sulfoxidireducens TaxID=2773299 RepID=UPI00159DD884|nr:sigma-54 dependent transcriptional regulator [Desulfolutivibrio sulfoxidireducens]QLA16895.1 response regulator [Desulfolutivibrio sulfoxidireducens]QLA20461.1 response regulator [Desulfolutivibrio sulfoxidireducens]
MGNILIIDDDTSFCRALVAVISEMDLHVETAHTLGEGLKKIRRGGYDVVILDVVLPDGNGLDAIVEIGEAPDQPEIIILTGSGDPDGAELAVKSGAWDYITKPPTMNKIRLPVARAVEYHARKAARPPEALRREAIIGGSQALRACLDMVARAAKSASNVLITGETGTGKELFARAIHQNSDRKDCPFVVVDCAALPEHLVESMLFGHEKGAFTTADKRHVGLIRQAHGGVLFLDEVGELPLEVQKAFLRVLQERRFRPVGGTREEESDFRVVAATNRDLDEMVAAWRFRQDLLFRLRTITIDLPPLRERTGDIEALARHFLETLTRETDGGPKRTSPEFWGALLEYTWPGNVRELGNALESALAAAGNDPVLLPRHLPINIRAMLARMSVNGGPCQADLEPMEERIVFSHDNFPTIKDFRTDALARVEHRYLAELLRVSEGKIQRACALSGLSRARLYALMKQYSIER